MKKTFNPIKLELTIESQDEFDMLWHRMNVKSDYLRGYAWDYGIDVSNLDHGVDKIRKILEKTK